MLRTIAVLAVVGMVGWLVFRVVFGIAGGLIAALLSLAWLALKVALFVGLCYWLLTVFAPDTAKKVRESVKL